MGRRCPRSYRLNADRLVLQSYLKGDAFVSMDDRDGWIWIDGQMVPWRTARIHILTHGLHYASSVFEGERAYDRQIFKLSQHSRRLLYSATCIDMGIPYDEATLSAASRQVLEANGLKNAYIRPVAWRGSEKIAAAAPDNSIHVAIAAWDMPRYFRPGAQSDGVRLKTSKWRRPPIDCAPAQAKVASSYVITTISKHEALREGYDDALLLDWKGRVSEATAANIFFVSDGELHTPTPECFLNGITRQTVIEIAKRLKLRVVERDIGPAEVSCFSECFLTGTASEIARVAAIDGQTFGEGGVSRMIAEAYADEVRATGG